MKKVTAYAELSKEYLYQLGGEIGLEGDALRMFMFFNEIKIELDVDEKTGDVVAWRPIK